MRGWVADGDKARGTRLEAKLRDIHTQSEVLTSAERLYTCLANPSTMILTFLTSTSTSTSDLHGGNKQKHNYSFFIKNRFSSQCLGMR